MDKKVIGVAAALAIVVGGSGAIANQHRSDSASAADTAVTTASFQQPESYTFRTVDDNADPTFNQLLGINNVGVIAGYFGSGAVGHPNRGYVVRTGEKAAFQKENAPNSVQTQVTGLNDHGVTVGFSSTMNNADQINDNTGFFAVGGRFHRVAFPSAHQAKPPVNQLLGVNDDGVAVGVYNDADGNSHGYRFDTGRDRFRTVTVPGATSVTAAAIDNNGDVAGFFTGSAGATDGFLLQDNGRRTVLAVPGAAMTQAFGVNDHREVVGAYTVGNGADATTHGFAWTAQHGFTTVDDPNGIGTTTVNGVNDAGALVGFYQDAAGNTHGMLAVARRTPPTTTTPPTTIPPTTTTTRTTPPTTPAQPGPSTGRITLRQMPAGTVSFGHNADGTLTARLDLFGLTPNSFHQVAIDNSTDAASAFDHVVNFPLITADGTGQVHTAITSAGTIGDLPANSRFTIRLSTYSSDATRTPVAMEAIARSAVLPARPADGTSFAFAAVSNSPNGFSNGQLSGTVDYRFDATAHTLTLTVNATGLSAGDHAAHIHQGSCMSQGPVLANGMLMDLKADANGDVVNQTRVVTGVTALPAAGTWYVNIHQGDMNTILVNGVPALPFRPLLCGDF